MQSWKSNPIHISADVIADVKATASGVVLGQGNEVWFHDLHLTPELAMEIADALTEGATFCIAAQEG